MSAHSGRGGARRNAGGTVSTVKISKPHAQALRTLLKARPGGAYSQAEVERWVEAQIDAALEAFDAETQRDAEKAWEGEVL